MSESEDERKESCGAETTSGTLCQKPVNYPDGHCYHHSGTTDNGNLGRPRGISKTDEPTILQAAEDGKPKRRIAEQLGVHWATVARYLERNPAFKELFEEAYCYEKYLPHKSKKLAPSEIAKIEVECSFCGEITTTWAYKYRKYDDHYCDEECKRLGQFEDNSRSYKGPNWRTQRQKALERDGNCCQSCGMTNSEHKRQYNQALHVHHIIERRHFDDDDPSQNELENLITLCRRCHDIYEGSQLKPLDRR